MSVGTEMEMLNTQTTQSGQIQRDMTRQQGRSHTQHGASYSFKMILLGNLLHTYLAPKNVIYCKYSTFICPPPPLIVSFWSWTFHLLTKKQKLSTETLNPTDCHSSKSEMKLSLCFSRNEDSLPRPLLLHVTDVNFKKTESTHQVGVTQSKRTQMGSTSQTQTSQQEEAGELIWHEDAHTRTWA